MDYDLLHRNCCHFCEELCLRLGFGPLPPWVTKLAAAGASLAAGEVRIPDCCVAEAGRCPSASAWCGAGRSGKTRVEKVVVVPVASTVARHEPDPNSPTAHLMRGVSPSGGVCLPQAGAFGGSQGSRSS